MTEVDVAALAASLGLADVETRMIHPIGIAEVSWKVGDAVAILRATQGGWDTIAEALRSQPGAR